MLDQEKWIGAQSIMKSLLENVPYERWPIDLLPNFKIALQEMEKYATIPEGEEWMNTNIEIPKQFWNQSQQAQTSWLTEWGKPMPVVNKVGRKEWYVHCKKADLSKLQKVFDERENEFQDMQNIQKGDTK